MTRSLKLLLLALAITLSALTGDQDLRALHHGTPTVSHSGDNPNPTTNLLPSGLNRKDNRKDNPKDNIKDNRNDNRKRKHNRKQNCKRKHNGKQTNNKHVSVSHNRTERNYQTAASTE
ncbi:hypothetical protein T492DRAFT_1084167 [Pavlovales sp. CCMP2436]|nr:hypothetical protein T492DRAFT_1084167 [Pavlovales sp. CCMP2436]